MRYLALACDYDGTIAHHGKLTDPTRAALERLRASGRKLILVSGRELDDLRSTCPHLDLFDRAVLENGGLLYRPATREQLALGPAPPPVFVEALRARGVGPISVGRTIVATWEPHETTVLETIRDLGLELQVIFNKGAVMVLPAGVNKASGLRAALAELKLSAHNVVAVGDAENDHAFLSMCECAVAVSNALPRVKETADFVTPRDHGDGVAELIGEMLADDLARRESLLARHHLLLGERPDGAEVRIPPYGSNLLIAGPSGSGKSTVTTGLMERLAEAGYQFCAIDPEGDYQNLAEAAVLGTPRRAPEVNEVLRLLEDPTENVVVNLLGVPLADRPAFFGGLLPRLQELRAQYGRPHWLILDEAHHLLPTNWEPAPVALPQKLDSALLITVHPDAVAPVVLRKVSAVIAVGETPAETLEGFARAVKKPAPSGDLPQPGKGEVTVWLRDVHAEAPFLLRPTPSHTDRRRHRRKYAEGELPPERSFHFRGPEEKLNLRCHNLHFFLQVAEGVDPDTWLHHLRQGDYSRWFREAIKDPQLAAEAEEVERGGELSAAESLARIKDAIQKRYTLPATPEA